MYVRVTKSTAFQLIKDHSINKTDSPKDQAKFVKDVNPIHLKNGIHLTFLRADQSPSGKEGFHVIIPER